MGYCNVAEVLGMIKADMYSTIIGGEYIEDAEEQRTRIEALAEDAVADATAEIDGYLCKRYEVPFSKTPQVVNKLAKDMAAYNLVSRAGLDEDSREKVFLTKYNAAVKFLLEVAKGTINIGVEEIGGNQKAAETGFQMHNSKRLFSRDSMRGW